MKKIVHTSFALVFMASLFCRLDAVHTSYYVLSVGDRLTIELPANPTTGYNWFFAGSIGDDCVRCVKQENIL